MATARLMETWAHGQDVADALGVTRTPTARLRHVAHLGVRTRDFAYLVIERPSRPSRSRVDLIGAAASCGVPLADAASRVAGPGARLLPAGHPAAAP